MPAFQFTSPEGKNYTVEGPEGSTAEQAFQILQGQIGSAPGGLTPDQQAQIPRPIGVDEPPAPPAPVDHRSFGTKALDVAVGPVDAGVTLLDAVPKSIYAGVMGLLKGGDEQTVSRILSEIRQPQTQTGQVFIGNISDLLQSHMAQALPGLGGELGMLGKGLSSDVAGIQSRIGTTGLAAPLPYVPKLPNIKIPGSGIVGKVLGTGAKTAANDLREKGIDLAGKQIDAATATAKPLEKQLTAVEKAQQQLANQPKIAEQRAAQRAVDPVRAAAEKIAVREKSAARAREAEAEQRKAGASVEQAKAAAQQAEAKHADAQAAVDAIEQEMLSKPGTSKESFGGMIRSAVEKLRDKYEGARSQAAQFGKVIEDAGEEPIVPTGGMDSVITENLKGIKNPNLQSVLERIQSLIGGGESQAPKGMQQEMNALASPAVPKSAEQLSLRQADSLRKYLDSIIQTRQIKDMAGNAMAVDKETMVVVRDVKSALMQSMTREDNPKTLAYKNALEQFRDKSRPLDIVERKGALRPVVDADPVSSEYALTEAQVVGKVIEKARSGNPTFTRLLEDSPELKDAARLYFTQDLFGPGAVPTEAALKTWLKTNSEPLRQLGLLDEFKDMKAARAAAQQAVQEAKGGVSEAGKALAAAKASETAATQNATSAVSMSKKSASRMQSALDSAGKAAAPKSNRADAARTGLTAKGNQLTRTLETQKKLATEFSTLQTTMRNEKNPAKLASIVESFANDMAKKGNITQDEYARILQQADEIGKHYADSKALQRDIMKIGKYLGIGTALGASGYVLDRVI